VPALLVLAAVTSGPTAFSQGGNQANENQVALLKKQVEEQQKQIDELRALLESQMRQIERMNAAAASNQVASLSPVLPAGTSATNQNVTPPNPAPVSQADQLKELNQRVEGVSKNLAGLKFSADLRFRTDAILRSANSVAGPQQNVRERYRMRLNVDKDLSPTFSTHLQLSSGPANNPLTFDTDFGGITARHPFLISEVFADYHPSKNLSFRIGRMPDVFADNSRFLFDDDIRFNGFQEILRVPLADSSFVKVLEFRGGQYILSNPNVQILSATSPFVSAGFTPGQKVGAANLFHQGVGFSGDLSSQWTHQFFADAQVYRNPNQIALASTAAGFPILVNGTFGLPLSGPLSGTGTATTEPGGARYSARDFQIVRLDYRLTNQKLKIGEREMPLWLDFQVSRNVGTARLKDAFMVTGSLGQVKKLGDLRFLYIYSVKDANAMISQVTDDDLGTGSGVNIATHHFRVDLGLTSFLQWQNLFFVQHERSKSDPSALFFVPLQEGAGTQYRIQSQLQFTF
jgi:hypothetical protein